MISPIAKFQIRRRSSIIKSHCFEFEPFLNHSPLTKEDVELQEFSKQWSLGSVYLWVKLGCGTVVRKIFEWVIEWIDVYSDLTCIENEQLNSQNWTRWFRMNWNVSKRKEFQILQRRKWRELLRDLKHFANNSTLFWILIIIVTFDKGGCWT